MHVHYPKKYGASPAGLHAYADETLTLTPTPALTLALTLTLTLTRHALDGIAYEKDAFPGCDPHGWARADGRVPQRRLFAEGQLVTRDELLAGTLPSVNETVELWMNHTFPNGVTLALAWETMPLHSYEAP